MNTLKITKIGNSAGVVLPKELLAHLGAQPGDVLTVVLTSRGISLCRPAVGEDDAEVAAREVAVRRRMALRALAEALTDEERAILGAR